MFEIIRSDTNFDFVSKRKFWFIFSIAVTIACLVGVFTKGLNYGIDFTGGAEVHVAVPAEWDIGKVRSTVESAGIKDSRVQQLGDPSENHYMIKAQGDESSLKQISAKIESALAQNLDRGQFQILKADVVGPAAGASLRKSAMLSVLYALIAILIYVTLRFDSRYAPGLVLALAHDAIVVVGLFVLLRFTFDLQVLAALLALIGYSCNDTIVVYDRIREVQQLNPKLTIEEAVNKAVNDTLSRTVLTAVTTFFVVFSLWLFGGPVLHDFAFALMAGIVVGTYSSVFVASSAVITLTHWYERRAARAKAGGAKTGWGPHRPQPRYHQ